MLSLLCKIRSGATEPLFKMVNVTAKVHEGRVEGRYSIEGSAEMPGFTFVVISLFVTQTKHQTKILHLIFYLSLLILITVA